MSTLIERLITVKTELQAIGHDILLIQSRLSRWNLGRAGD